jgi:hypothetical protein
MEGLVTLVVEIIYVLNVNLVQGNLLRKELHCEKLRHYHQKIIAVLYVTEMKNKLLVPAAKAVPRGVWITIIPLKSLEDIYVTRVIEPLDN